LHFEIDRMGVFRAIAAVPVNAQETIPIQVAWESESDTTHRLVRMPVAPGGFSSERLSVDPRFSTAPDSALQVRIRRESAASRQVSINSHSTPRLWHGQWVRPRPGRVTSYFGTGRVFNGEIQSRHMGTDLDGETGDPIRAGNRGRVALVGDFYYAGNVVYLDHGAGLITIYMHMSAVEVEQGQIVEAGDVIGRVGSTGRVTGPHLHWTGRYGRISVDPLTVFELDPTVLPAPAPLAAEPISSR
jgi:murein DD-endopeptidase MepM/ murein hydrolase activator NlpD